MQITKTPADYIGIAASLIYTGEALWRRAAFEMQPPVMRVLGACPFAPLSAPNGVMVGYAIFDLAAALFIAVRAFNRRDL